MAVSQANQEQANEEPASDPSAPVVLCSFIASTTRPYIATIGVAKRVRRPSGRLQCRDRLCSAAYQARCRAMLVSLFEQIIEACRLITPRGFC